MGDLKKKKDDGMPRINKGEDINGSKENLTDEQTIERLQYYIKKFYELQIKKQEQKDEE